MWAGFAFDLGFEIGWESFELGWANDDYLTEFGPGDVEQAIFDDGVPGLTTEDVEDFEEGWSNNEDWQDVLVSTAFAVFDAGTPQPFEDYEEEWGANEDWLRYFTEPGFIVFDYAGWQPPDGIYRVNVFGAFVTHTSIGGEEADDISEALFDLLDSSGLPLAVTQDSNSVFITPDDPRVDIELSVQGPVDDTFGETMAVRTSNIEPGSIIVRAEFNTALDDKEEFEAEWRDNENFLFALGPTGTADFDQGTPEPFEDFEDEWPTEIMQTIV